MGNESSKYFKSDVEIASFKKLIDLNPQPGKPYIDYKIDSTTTKNKRYNYCLYSWMTGEDTDRYVNTNQLRKFLKLKFNASVQIYYDIICVGLTSIKDRPLCPVCGKELSFDSLSHGYPVTCCKKCHRIHKRVQIQNNPLMTKKGDVRTEQVKKKISNTLRSKDISYSDVWRKKHSDFMKAFAKTKKGREFYKKVGEINSKKNIERLKGSTIDRGGYFTNRVFKRGIYESESLNKTLNYDSGWELKFIQYLENESIKEVINVVDRCKDHVIYYWDDGSRHRYLPDFFIEFNSGIRIVIEIKPSYLLKISRKVQLCIEAGKEYFESRGIRFYVLTEHDLFDNKGIIKSSFSIIDFDK